MGDSATLRVRSSARFPPPVPGKAPTAVGSPAAHTGDVHRVASSSTTAHLPQQLRALCRHSQHSSRCKPKCICKHQSSYRRAQAALCRHLMAHLQ